MNSYKKTVIASGIALLAFQACHATPEFDRLKSQMAETFNPVFEPANSILTKLTKDAQIKTKLNNFHKALLDIGLFVKNNSKGMIFESGILTQTNESLVTETNALMANLNEMSERLKKTKNLAGEHQSKTEAQVFFINFGDLKNKIATIKEILQPMANKYTSIGQKESFMLLMDALQTLSNAAENIRSSMMNGQWLK